MNTFPAFNLDMWRDLGRCSAKAISSVMGTDDDDKMSFYSLRMQPQFLNSLLYMDDDDQYSPKYLTGKRRN